MRTSGIFGMLTVLAVAAVIVANGPLMLGQSTLSDSKSPTSAYQTSPNGLWLRLSISSSTIGAGQPLAITVDSYNPTNSGLNATAARAWALEGLRVDSCYASIYPFGVALYQGTYAAGNVTQGKPLQIFPNVPCPMLIRLVTGYYFGPESGNATVLPGTGSPTPMAAKVTVGGTYPAQGTAVQPLVTGPYTVVAGDEWGALVFLHFQVR